MKNKTIAMIPARMGSTRFKKKNLAMINGKPMIYYAIEAAKKAEVFDRIVVNSEDIAFEDIAKRYGVEFYLRPTELGSSTAKSDDVVADFMKKNPAQYTAWINSVSPLQESLEIKNVIEFFQKKDLDSLITAIEEKVHCMYQGKPINFSFGDKFAQTQDLTPIYRFVYSIMMWRNETFLADYEKKGVAMVCGKFDIYPVDKLSGVIVKSQRDFEICQMIIEGQKGVAARSLTYDPQSRE